MKDTTKFTPIETLFAQALGLEAPWPVERIAFSEADERLDIHLVFPKEASSPARSVDAKEFLLTTRIRSPGDI